MNAWNGGVGYTPAAGSGKHAYLNGGNGLNAAANAATGASSLGGQASGTMQASGGSMYEPGWNATDDGNIGPIDPSFTCESDDTWTPSAGANENLPINCVNWYEAYAFCIWDGGFLPSEAEWEYAAVGGSQQREYPWGSTDPGTTNQYAIYACDYPNGLGACMGTVGSIAPVGYPVSGAGLWGQLDLAGEVSEWNLDWYATYTGCTDCANTTSSSGAPNTSTIPGATGARAYRGGYYFALVNMFLLPTARSYAPPSARIDLLGFRCSRTP